MTRTIPWPRGEEREFVNIRFSPDGKLLYFFGDDVLILETTNFTEVDTWPLSRRSSPGLGRVNFGSVDDFNEIRASSPACSRRRTRSRTAAS